MIGTLALYNRSKLLLQNTLITDPQQIPNELVCTSGMCGNAPRFRFEDGTTILVSKQGQSVTVQNSHLNQNGRYLCSDDVSEWSFHIFSNGEYIHTVCVHVIMHVYVCLKWPQMQPHINYIFTFPWRTCPQIPRVIRNF